MSSDQHLVAKAAHCWMAVNRLIPYVPREKQAMEMTEYGNHGKP
jgi:hypothetical protein